MPPPPPPLPSTAAIFVFLILLPLQFLTTVSLAHSCSNPPPKAILCPPFTTPPPFPFSFFSGCGHPSFQIHCASNSRASISINNLSFSLLQYEPDSTSLSLFPSPPIPSLPHHNNCSSPPTVSTLNRSISLSGSLFRVSDSSCSRLSVLIPCPPLNLPNCSHCSWECKLIKNPIHLIHDCGDSSTHHREDSQLECRDDVLVVLEGILQKGLEIEWDEKLDPYFSNCKSCRARNGFCGFNSSEPSKPFICFTTKITIRSQNPTNIAILSIVFVFLCLLIALSVSTVIFRSKRKALTDFDEDPTIIFLHRHRSASLLPPVFSYEELNSSTNGFDTKRKIGDGGFGSVYLGNLHDGRLVAVKHLHKQQSSTRAATEKGFSTKAFCNEILILSSIEHPNLVKLHGYCGDPRGLLLVYDYVPNGTLADHLHGKQYRKGSLKWNTRIDIAFQIALVIEYLHFRVVPPVIHRDITSSNIFVEKDMRVKVGDFGLSRFLVCSKTSMVSENSSEGVWTGPQGTPGYLDPDYYRSFMLNEKSDVYSFGVVLLELITRMRAVEEKREMTLVDLVVPRIQMGLLQEVVDPILLMDKEVMEGVCAVAELAFRCVAADKEDRPDATEVVETLRRIKGSRLGGGVGGGLVKGSSNSSNVVVPDVV